MRAASGSHHLLSDGVCHSTRCVSKKTPADQPASRTTDQGSNQQLIFVQSTIKPPSSLSESCWKSPSHVNVLCWCSPSLLPGPAC